MMIISLTLSLNFKKMYAHMSIIFPSSSGPHDPKDQSDLWPSTQPISRLPAPPSHDAFNTLARQVVQAEGFRGFARFKAVGSTITEVVDKIRQLLEQEQPGIPSTQYTEPQIKQAYRNLISVAGNVDDLLKG